MDTPSVGRVVLMSIHPQYAQAILDGTKRVEFRKRPLAPDVSHVVVYATAPVSAVVGAFAVTGQRTQAPSALWRRFRTVAGIPRSGFFAYFQGRRHGTGIEVGDVLVPAAPLRLDRDLGVARPPQSFQYLARETACPLLASMSSQS